MLNLEKSKNIIKKYLRQNKSFERTSEPKYNFFDLISVRCGGFENKRVLEVGCDLDGKILKQISDKNAKETIGIDLIAHNRMFARSCYMKQGDVRNLDFSDDYFDIIISLSVFEHVQDLDIAMKEMYRVLKPGGCLYSHFGPLWSTSYGHHLNVIHNNDMYCYWNVILPPYCHLLMTPDELMEFCIKDHDEDLSRKIVDFVFNSPEQNQQFFEDYERIFSESDFKTISFNGYIHPVLSSLYTPENFTQTLEALQDKFPGYNNFIYDGITVLLKK